MTPKFDDLAQKTTNSIAILRRKKPYRRYENKMINESREEAGFARPEDDPAHPRGWVLFDGSTDPRWWIIVALHDFLLTPSPVNDSLNPISSLNLFRALVISTFLNHAKFSPGNRLTNADGRTFSTVFRIDRGKRYRVFLTSDLVKAKRDSKFETSSWIVSTMIGLTIRAGNRVYRMMDIGASNLRLGGSRGGFESSDAIKSIRQRIRVKGVIIMYSWCIVHGLWGSFEQLI